MLDLKAIEDEYLQQCGPHDYGMVEYGCRCPSGDPRSAIVRLVDEVRDLRAKVPASKPSRRLAFGRLQIYVEPRDAWVGVYVSTDAVYVLLLPFVVMRWHRAS